MAIMATRLVATGYNGYMARGYRTRGYMAIVATWLKWLHGYSGYGTWQAATTHIWLGWIETIVMAI